MRMYSALLLLLMSVVRPSFCAETTYTDYSVPSTTLRVVGASQRKSGTNVTACIG